MRSFLSSVAQSQFRESHARFILPRMLGKMMKEKLDRIARARVAERNGPVQIPSSRTRSLRNEMFGGKRAQVAVILEEVS